MNLLEEFLSIKQTLFMKQNLEQRRILSLKSCIEWRKSFKNLPEIDQFNIDYRNKEIKLLNFLNQYAQTQRVNIRLPEGTTEDDIELLEAAADKGFNIAIILPGTKYTERLKDKNIKFYFEEACYTWDDLQRQINLGVSDVFISGQLGFEIKQVSEMVGNIQIRCYANICQPNIFGEDGFKSFYIRPEDVDFYSKYVDIIEFFNSVKNQQVLYDVYFKTKEWNGKLREIIKGMTSDINNYYILGSEFARRRSECGKKCLKGNRCQLCDRLTELANTIEDSDDYDVFKRR